MTFGHPFHLLAEAVGFEPTVPVDTAVFETARFGRSRTLPCMSLLLDALRLLGATGSEKISQQYS